MKEPQNSPKKVMLSAVTPSGDITLGNYLGALKNWVSLQAEYDCIFFAVNLHGITVRQDPAQLLTRTYQAVTSYIGAGIDPEQATLFLQSQVPAHAELAWVLMCNTYMGELNRMTQFKDKSTKQGQNIGAGLFTYPVLMAADILLYQTHLVPVGEDQKQHLEITRDVAGRMNAVYGEDLFTMPEVFIPKVGGRIMSLQNPLSKMSKSDSDANASVFLLDSNDQIIKKFKKAVTDSGSEILNDETKPGIRNLLQIQSAITKKPISEIVESYRGKQYGHLKLETADLVIAEITPVRNKIRDLLNNLDYVDSLLKQGAMKAQRKAEITLKKVYDRVGFNRAPSTQI